jgi:DNA invertase Pin-like site-specific DNA recombinase
MMHSTMTGPLKLDGIVRVSKTGERETLRSPAQQESDIRRWAKDNGHEIVHVHVAIDETGAKKTGHPAIEAAKARALGGVVDGVIAPYLSRFTRNTVYGLETVQALLDAGKHFFSPDCPFDLRTPEGEKYLTDKLADARYEWRKLRANFGRGVEEAIERGSHLQAGYGYAKANGKGSGLIVVEAEAEQVKRAFELRAAGHSWAAIAEQLNASGAAPRPYKRDGQVQQAVWTHKTTRHLVVGKGPKREWSVYLGMAFNGKQCVEGAHPAIVSPELFAAANDTKGTKPVGPDEGYLLSGLLRCAGCGYSMAHASEKGGRYYRCRSAQHGAGRCPEPASVPAIGTVVRGDYVQGIEEAVWTRFTYEHLDNKSNPIEDDGRVDAAKAAKAKAAHVTKQARKLFLLAETPSEEAAAEREVKDAQRAERDADDELAEANAQARGGRLPARLTTELAFHAPVSEQRHWLSLVYGAIAVRKARVWREPAEARAQVFARDEVPTDLTALRNFIQTRMRGVVAG